MGNVITGGRVLNIIAMSVAIYILFFTIWSGAFMVVTAIFVIISVLSQLRGQFDDDYRYLIFISYYNGSHLPWILDVVFYACILYTVGMTYSWGLFLMWWYITYVDIYERVKAAKVWSLLDEDIRNKIRV